MFRIVNKKELNSTVTLLEIEAPFVARKAQAVYHFPRGRDERTRPPDYRGL